jgi:hypothetical protein
MNAFLHLPKPSGDSNRQQDRGQCPSRWTLWGPADSFLHHDDCRYHTDRREGAGGNPRAERPRPTPVKMMVSLAACTRATADEAAKPAAILPPRPFCRAAYGRRPVRTGVRPISPCARGLRCRRADEKPTVHQRLHTSTRSNPPAWILRFALTGFQLPRLSTSARSNC